MSTDLSYSPVARGGNTPTPPSHLANYRPLQEYPNTFHIQDGWFVNQRWFTNEPESVPFWVSTTVNRNAHLPENTVVPPVREQIISQDTQHRPKYYFSKFRTSVPTRPRGSPTAPNPLVIRPDPGLPGPSPNIYRPAPRIPTPVRMPSHPSSKVVPYGAPVGYY